MLIDPLVDQLQRISDSTYPTATMKTVLETELALGFPLPPLLRELYLHIGNGGYGPADCTLIGLRGGHEYIGQDLVALYSDFRKWADVTYLIEGQMSSLWPERLLPVFLWPCTIYTCLDCSRPEVSIYILDTNFIKDEEEHVPCPLIKHKDSLHSWLAAWWVGEDLWSEMDHLTNEVAREMTGMRGS